MRQVFAAAKLDVRSVAFDGVKLGVKSAFVRLQPPPLPWLADASTATAAAAGATAPTAEGSNGDSSNGSVGLKALKDDMAAADLVLDGGGVKAEGVM